jgi:hypothetical protein
MSDWPLLAFDVAAITVLGFGIYFPRYRRQDLLLSFNLGVLTVMVALSDTEVGLGVGFGLFGILSIIRLRSAELEQQEIAYYFASLVLGLVNGVGLDPAWLAPAASVALLAALYFVDHPRVHPRYRNQVMTLDRAFTDEAALRHFLEDLLNASISHLVVKRVDLVNDTTVVDVRFRLPKPDDPPFPADGRPAPAASTGSTCYRRTAAPSSCLRCTTWRCCGSMAPAPSATTPSTSTRPAWTPTSAPRTGGDTASRSASAPTSMPGSPCSRSNARAGGARP